MMPSSQQTVSFAMSESRLGHFVNLIFLDCASLRYPWGARGLRLWWLTNSQSIGRMNRKTQ